MSTRNDIDVEENDDIADDGAGKSGVDIDEQSLQDEVNLALEQDANDDRSNGREDQVGNRLTLLWQYPSRPLRAGANKS